MRTVWGAVLAAVVLGLLCLIAPAAAAALFSLAVAGNNLAWGVPVFARAVWGRDKFVPGPFHTGRLSLPIAWASLAFMVFGMLLAMFPVGGPGPAPESMNYTVVVNAAVWGGCTVYYFVDARKWFTGPKSTVEEEAEAINGREVAAERGGDGLAVVDGKGTETEGSVPEGNEAKPAAVKE